MSLTYVRQHIIPVTMALLPGKMDSPEARAMLIAIGLQESRFLHRAQIGGPARGFWQFEEPGGFKGVLRHSASAYPASEILARLSYKTPEFEALTHNDVLACAFARLLLWTHPKRLPNPSEPDYGWDYYYQTWRPGKPHRNTWDGFFKQAWKEVELT